jgi:hypothetical protein
MLGEETLEELQEGLVVTRWIIVLIVYFLAAVVALDAEMILMEELEEEAVE